MKKTIFAGLLGLAFSNLTFAAEDINLKDVIVVASRVAQSPENVIGDVSVISREEIERAGQSTFIELLQKQPGVEISSNGGAGSLASVYLRGANANQTIVLIDGVRINSITVIQIFTKQGTGSPQFNAAIGYGSYNTRTAEAGMEGSYNSLNYSINVSNKETDGFSALRISNDAREDKDGYSNLSANGSISYNINERNSFGIRFFDSKGKIDYDSSIAFNNTNKSKQTSLSLFSKNKINDIWTSNLTASKGVDRYDDKSYSDYFNSWSESYIKSIQNQYSWQNNFELTLGTFTLAYDRLEQDLKTSYAYQGKSRDSNGYYFGYLKDIGAHSIQTNFRLEDSTQYGKNTTGYLGYGYRINPNWRATTSYGTAFKAPTFNDVYAPSGWGANPNINPEESENIEASLRYSNETSLASVTLYQNKITDLILSSGSPNYQMGNIGKAELKGITIAASTSIHGWSINGNLDIQSPENSETKKMLPFRANRHGSINLGKSWGDWNFNSELIGSSERYNNPSNTQKMNGYMIVNLVADYKINNQWSLQGRVNNLFNKDYALALNSAGNLPYNTPGSNLFVSLAWRAK